MKKLFLYCIATLLSAGIAFAQEVIVFGQVLDAANQEPIQAANVWFKGTQIGSSTNDEGYFLLRTTQPQKTVCISVLGYKRREVNISKNNNQMITILLREEQNVLNEVIVVPGENEALPILRNVLNAKNKNNPDKIINISTSEEHQTKLFFFNIKQRTLQRKLFRDMQQGVIRGKDSLLIIPVYYEQRTDELNSDSVGNLERKLITKNEKSLNIIPENQLHVFLDTYTPQINFYKNHVTILQSNFISPIANQGRLYYHYFLMDSLKNADRKTYHIRFRPKNNKELAFKGDMWIDSATYAITHIRGSMPTTANINFMHSLIVEQTFEKLQHERFYYTNQHVAMGFKFDIANNSTKNGISTMFEKSINYSNTQFDTQETPSSKRVTENDSLTIAETNFRNAIDSINKSKLQKVALNIVDLVMNGYVHAWKLDLGPVVNWIRYNKLEGFRPTIALRTGQKMMNNFTIGGYVGYGFSDKQWKYGSEFQTRFGVNYKHTIGFFYDNDVIRYGYKNVLLVNENMVGSTENLLTTLSRITKYDNLAQQHKATLTYRYEQEGVRFTTSFYAKELFSNNGMPFVQDGIGVNSIKSLSATIGLRLSFKEKSLNNYFHRYYLRTIYPIINIQGEYGYYEVGNKQSPYGKVVLTVKQNIPLFSGKLKYLIESGYVFGDVPFPLLESPRGTRGVWFPEYDFCLMNQMEFLTDAYIMGNFCYITSGWIFNHIPWVKKANLREELLFKVAYGGLRNKHHTILELPENSSGINTPYMEAGVGISNILRLFSVQSVWRLTHRNAPNAINWGIRFRFNLDF
ncbi:MAG TPA: DUF5686 family protein [Paludibacteraceae bacterium]|nr:DUF5686 family protein [Paludibacteraceae bacterium]HQB68848.1 DUF5686 family protein [Paludibacteraceae bacterium]